MIFVIGGAYQGKLDFVKEAFGIREGEIFSCAGGEIDFSFRCIANLEEFVRENPDPIGYFEKNKEKWQDSLLICQDIFCGVVPMGAENREWRQNCGRFCQYLAKEAARVSRIFCGLELRLK